MLREDGEVATTSYIHTDHHARRIKHDASITGGPATLIRDFIKASTHGGHWAEKARDASHVTNNNSCNLASRKEDKAGCDPRAPLRLCPPASALVANRFSSPTFPSSSSTQSARGLSRSCAELLRFGVQPRLRIALSMRQPTRFTRLNSLRPRRLSCARRRLSIAFSLAVRQWAQASARQKML